MNQLPPFRNEPLIDWSIKENRDQMKYALDGVKQKLGKAYSLVIGGEKIQTTETITSVNPANYREIIGFTAKANQDSAEHAVMFAKKAQESWRNISITQRAEYLFKVAGIIREQRFEWMAWVVYEAGKNWKEADADIAEAIDFLEYYGRQTILLMTPSLTDGQIPGEMNIAYFIPRGVSLVLGIWNFPCAINTGMIAASIVSGNTAIFKPASLTPVTGHKIMEAFQEAGLPDGVLNYLPGSGAKIGEYLVKHPDTNIIVLTGSKDAGLRIDHLAGEHAARYGVKRRILETGGKNAIIVDSDADLDEAINGIISSWLGFQGQKCSACSRLIILGSIHDVFVKRLVEAARSLQIGDPRDPANFMGPLISQDALNKVQKYIQIGKSEATLAFLGNLPEEISEKGYYAGPALFTDVRPEAKIAQEEIFGPVLALIKIKTFEEAIAIANSTGYALTGGVYSRSLEHIEKAKDEFDVGNLYINRSITGAFVGRQPFGGHRCSGTGPKAGSPDYLKAFMNAKVISENTIRRGFAPLPED